MIWQLVGSKPHSQSPLDILLQWAKIGRLSLQRMVIFVPLIDNEGSVPHLLVEEYPFLLADGECVAKAPALLC